MDFQLRHVHGSSDISVVPFAYRLRWLIVSVTVAACGSLMTIGADSRWLAALGDAVLESRRVPQGVPYAAAASSGWHNVPVLGELIFAGLERGLGDRGLILLQVVAVAIALAVVARGMPAEAGIFLLLVPIAALDSFLVVRSQVFSLALFPLLVLLLRREAAEPSRRIWLLVPLVALWANLHGGVLIGLAVAACYLLFERLRHDKWTAVAVLIASAAAVFATPAGLATAAYYRHVFGNAWRASHQGLWATPSLRHPFDIAFFVCIPVLGFMALKARPRAWEYAAGAGLALSAVTAARNEVWLVLFLAPAAVRHLQHLPAPRLPMRRALALVALLMPATVLALAVGSPSSARVGAGPALQQQAVSAAHGTPILADPYDAEQLALGGAKIVIGNPIDAFTKHDQWLYLHWLQGSETAAYHLTSNAGAVLIGKDDPAQRLVARNPAFCRAAADQRDVLYVRCADLHISR
ncbi:MAG: hypothetical protein ACXVRA_08120 [Gaiellaceae bacterium]